MATLNDLAIYRKHIAALIERDNRDYQDLAARRERAELHLIERDKEFPIWEQLERFAFDVVMPFATTIVMKGIVDKPETALGILQARPLLSFQEIAAWYFHEGDHYPNTKANADTLEYLRLLTIEYILLQNQK